MLCPTKHLIDLHCRYESYLSHSDPVVLALNPFFILEYVTHPSANITQLIPSLETILPHHVAPNYLVPQLLSTLLWASSMISALNSLNQTQYAAFPYVWTNTSGCLAQLGFRLLRVVRWRWRKKRGMWLSFGEDNSVQKLHFLLFVIYSYLFDRLFRRSRLRKPPRPDRARHPP